MSTKELELLITADESQASGAFAALMGGLGDIQEEFKKGESGVKSWAMAFTAINQAKELALSALSGLKTVASWGIEAASAVKDFVASGGDFNEQRVQFEHFAQSMGHSGDAIISMVKDISGNTMTIKESMDVAAQAVKTRLSEQELGTVLTYAKRWSEQTGQSFSTVANTMSEAMARGRTSVLSSFGIIVDETGDVKGALAEMEQGIKNFGSTGINIGDNVKSISVAWEDVKTKVSSALADVPSLQEAFQGVSDTVSSFVKSLDTRWITDFVEVGVQIVAKMAEGFGFSFDSVSAGFEGIFSNNAVNMAKSFFSSMVSGFDVVVTAFGVGWNSIIDAIQMLNVGNWFSGIISIVTVAVGGLIDIVGTAVGEVANIFGSVMEKIGTMAQNSPNIASMLGITPESAAIYQDWGKTIQATGQDIKQSAKDFADVPIEFGLMLDGTNDSLEGFKINLGDIQEYNANLIADINQIDYDGTVTSLDDAKNSAKDFLAEAEKIPKELDEISGKMDVTGKMGSLLGDEDKKKIAAAKPRDDRSVVNVRVSGEDLVLAQFYERIIQIAIDDAVAKGIMVVRQ